jgi:hypothetical protein
MYRVGVAASLRTLAARLRLTPLDPNRKYLWIAVFAITVFAALVRWYLTRTLPLDIDERIYLPIAQDYARMIAAGQWGALLAYQNNLEHPIFVKLAFAAAIRVANALQLNLPDLVAARAVSTIAGSALVALVAFVNPIAGVALATQKTEAYYTSEAYFEAIPALSSAMAVLSYVRYRQTRQSRFFVLAAIALGVTAASKYAYITAGVALLPFIVWDHRRQIRRLVQFGAISLVVFLLCDPILWIDPVNRLTYSLVYHFNYSHSGVVLENHLPWWWELWVLVRPDNSVTRPLLSVWQALLVLLSVCGLKSLAMRAKPYLLWYLLSLAFLLVWQTKWPQYTLILVTPMCLSAGFGVTDGAQWLTTRIRNIMRRVHTAPSA